jgi:hypothetical protein
MVQGPHGLYALSLSKLGFCSGQELVAQRNQPRAVLKKLAGFGHQLRSSI